MHKQFEDYEAEERLISLLKNSELRRKYKTRMERRRSNLNKARFLFVVLLLAILFTAAVMEFCLAAPEHNEPTDEKVVENVAEGSAEVAAFDHIVQSSDQSGSLPGDDTPATTYASLELYMKENPQNKATFVVTHYCGCSKCCGKWSSGSESNASGALGIKLTPYYSIAVDPDIIPLGTILYDSEGNEYRAEDTGSAIKGYRIDLFIGNHQEALNLGKVSKEFTWNNEV